jgi:hypothetical protein
MDREMRHLPQVILPKVRWKSQPNPSEQEELALLVPQVLNEAFMVRDALARAVGVKDTEKTHPARVALLGARPNDGVVYDAGMRVMLAYICARLGYDDEVLSHVPSSAFDYDEMASRIIRKLDTRASIRLQPEDVA